MRVSSKTPKKRILRGRKLDKNQLQKYCKNYLNSVPFSLHIPFLVSAKSLKKFNHNKHIFSFLCCPILF